MLYMSLSSSTGPDRHSPSSLCVQQLGERSEPRWRWQCAGLQDALPLCAAPEWYLLLLYRGLLQAVWKLLFLLVYTLFRDGVAALKWGSAVGKGQSVYVFSKLLLADVYDKFCFHSLCKSHIGCPAYLRNKLYFTGCLCCRFAVQE